MALHLDTVDVPIDGGLDVKTTPNKLAPPALTTADNVFYQTTGALRKRYGFSSLPVTTVGGGSLVPTSCLAISVVNNELIACDGTSLYAWSPSIGAWQIKGKDSFPGLTALAAVTPQNLQESGNTFSNFTFADYGNYRLVAYDSAPAQFYNSSTNYNSLRVGLWDKQKNTWLTAPQNNSNPSFTQTLASNPVVVNYGRYFYVFFLTSLYLGPSPSGTIGCYLFDTQQLGSTGFYWPVPTIVAAAFSDAPGVSTVGDPSTRFFVDASATPSTLAVMYGLDFTDDGTYDHQGPTQTYYQVVTTAGQFPNQYNSGVPIYGTGASVTGWSQINTAGNFIIAASSYTTVAQIYNWTNGHASGTFTTVIQPSNTNPYLTSATCAFGTVTATTGSFIISVPGQLASLTQSPGFLLGTFVETTMSGSPTIVVTLTGPYNYPWPNQPVPIMPIAKPTYYNGEFYQWLLTTGAASVYLQPTANLSGLVGSSVKARVAYDAGILPNLLYSGNTSWQAPTPTSFEIPVVSGNTMTFMSISTAAPKVILPLQNSALISGVHPTYYDTVQVWTMGFDGYPELTPLLAPTTTGSLTVSTYYFYSGIYRAYDANGRAMLSSPGNFPGITLTSSQYGISFLFGTTNFGLPYQPGIGEYGGIYDVVLYRNTAADTTDLREIGLLPGVGVTSTYFDGAADAKITAAGLPFLYAPPSGGELQNDPPVPFNIATASQTRIYTNSMEHPTRLYFGKPFSPLRTPEFNQESYIEIDPSTGPITGLSVMDGVIYIFKANNIYALTDSGPDANGNGSFPPPSKLSVDAGSINSTSIVLTNLGIFFQSVRGINLLSRSQTVQYLGAPVEPYVQGNTVTCALNVPQYSQARFYMNTGVVLVFDYLHQKWSRFTSQNGYYATSACIWNGSVVTLDTVNGAINVETTAFTDNGNPITMTIETPWLPYKHPQSWNRLRRVSLLGDYKSTSTATLYFAYDWNNTYQDTVTFNTGTGLTTIDTVYQWVARAPRQVMQAVRLKLVDTTVTGESYDITNFALEYAIKGGIARLPDRKKV